MNLAFLAAKKRGGRRGSLRGCVGEGFGRNVAERVGGGALHCKIGVMEALNKHRQSWLRVGPEAGSSLYGEDGEETVLGVGVSYLRNEEWQPIFADAGQGIRSTPGGVRRSGVVHESDQVRNGGASERPQNRKGLRCCFRYLLLPVPVSPLYQRFRS